MDCTVPEARAGLNAYLSAVFGYLTGGLLLASIVAAVFGNSPAAMATIMHGGLITWAVMLAPLGIVFFLSSAAVNNNVSTARFLYWLFTASIGLSMSTIFVRYSLGSITSVLFITSAMFGSMALWGWMTKRDLSGMGSILFMILIGLIIAMVVNIFLQNSMMHLLISAAVVIVFALFTAYDMQSIKAIYYEGGATEGLAILGATNLFLDFVNIFQGLLSLFGVPVGSDD